MTNRFDPYSHLTLDGGPGYPTSAQLAYAQPWRFDCADQVYDAILALRDGITRPRSPFKIRGLGPIGYNATVDWLEACGYPVDGMKLRVKPRKPRWS